MVKKKSKTANKSPKSPSKNSQSPKIKAVFSGDKVISNSSAAVQLCNQSRFGEIIDGKVSYSLVEAFYLMKKAKMEVSLKGKKLSAESFFKEASKLDHNLSNRYSVFSDLRNRGYLVKTALKFGADFRVYDRGVKPGDDHAKWVLYPVHEASSFTWYDFSAKNRVAHSTRKNLLLGIVDDEGDVTFYEVKWTRP